MHGPSFLAADTHGTTALLRNHTRTHALKHADDYDYYHYYYRKGQIAAEGFPVSHLTLPKPSPHPRYVLLPCNEPLGSVTAIRSTNHCAAMFSKGYKGTKLTAYHL